MSGCSRQYWLQCGVKCNFRLSTLNVRELTIGQSHVGFYNYILFDVMEIELPSGIHSLLHLKGIILIILVLESLLVTDNV